MTEQQIEALLNKLSNAAAFFTMEYNKAKAEGVNIPYGLDSKLRPILREALLASPAEQPASKVTSPQNITHGNERFGPKWNAEQPGVPASECNCDSSRHKNIPCPVCTPAAPAPAGEEPSEAGWTLGATEFHSDKPPITEQEVVRYSQNDLDAAVQQARLEEARWWHENRRLNEALDGLEAKWRQAASDMDSIGVGAWQPEVRQCAKELREARAAIQPQQEGEGKGE